MASISELVQGCFTQFNSLIKSETLIHCTEVHLQDWRDELGRLRVWAANIGAHQTRQSSLDYRLRDASHIRSQIVVLLGQVQELLTDLEDVLQEQNDGDAQNHDSEYIDDASESELSMEIQEIHEGLVDTIGQLYQMSMLIRKPSQHDRLVGTEKADSEPFQFWAKSHTSEKYPNADPLAIDRISSAMARQRAVLKYRERHHEKLSKGIDPESDGKSTVLSETVVTDVLKEIPSQINDLISEAGVSETSYGGTLLEGTGSDAPKIPPRPKGAENGPFECPYCFYIITAKDKKSWARHIFRDLMPYVCIFPECPTPNKLYESRRQWHHHIKQAHVTPAVQNDSYDCSICRRNSLPISNFQKHVGQHLEELALFLLPRTNSDEHENEGTDEEGEGNSINENACEQSLDGHLEENLDMTDGAEVAFKSLNIDGTSSDEPQNDSKTRLSLKEEDSIKLLPAAEAEVRLDRESHLARDQEMAEIVESEAYEAERARFAEFLGISAEDTSANTAAELSPEDAFEYSTEDDHHPESDNTPKISNTADFPHERSAVSRRPDNGFNDQIQAENSDDEIGDVLGSPAPYTSTDHRPQSRPISANANESDLSRNPPLDQMWFIGPDGMDQTTVIENQEQDMGRLLTELERNLDKFKTAPEKELTPKAKEEYGKDADETWERAKRVKQNITRDLKQRAAEGSKPSGRRLRELEEEEETTPKEDELSSDSDQEIGPEINLKAAREQREKIRKRLDELEKRHTHEYRAQPAPIPAPMVDRRAADQYPAPIMHAKPQYAHPMAYHGEQEQLSPPMMAHPQTNFGIIGDPIDSKSKRRRGNLPKPMTDILQAWFHDHLDYPYPSEEDKQMFMTRTGLSISQISNWFITARRRQLPALRNQMRTGADDSSRHSSFSDVDQGSDLTPPLLKNVAAAEAAEKFRPEEARRASNSEEDLEFRARLREDLGFDEEEIEGILNKKRSDKGKKANEDDKGKNKEEGLNTKNTWIKNDPNYIVIMRWITEDFQEELFAHTKRIREGKVVFQTGLKGDDRGKDKIRLVRKKKADELVDAQ
ncbi:hypothetical protein N7488_005609 [Penicillium malachiteum]|nr:hypothetical protein N7488_005609 [Penicillium malachiteum]